MSQGCRPYGYSNPVTRDSLLNIGAINGSGEYPFINRMKQWAVNPVTDSNTPPYPLQVNSDGFPVGTLPAVLSAQFDFPPSYSGDWIIDWVGATGGNAFSQSMNLLMGTVTPTIISGSSFVVGTGTGRISLFGTNGSVRFNVGADSSGAATFQFLTTGTFSSMTSMRVYRADQAAALVTGPFNPDFLNAITAIKPRILRFLDWRVVNQGNATAFSKRALTSNISYNVGKWIPGDYVGDIGQSAANTYTCGDGTNHNPSAYVDKETVQGRFTIANTSTTVTLNRNNLGPITVLTSDPRTAVAVGGIAANQLATLVYDQKLNVYLYAPAGISSNVGGEVAMEDIITLCNTVGCDMWINLSHLIDSASITSFVNLIAGLLNGKLYLEYSNELWNAIFDQNGYAIKQSTAFGFTHPYYSYVGLRVAQTAQTAATAWTGAGRARSDLKVVDAWQATDSSGGLSFNGPYLYALLGTELTTQGFSSSPNRPGDLADVFSWAPYTAGNVTQNGDDSYANPLTTLYTAADNWFSGNTSASRSFFDTDIRGAMNTQASSVYPFWETVRTQTWAGSVKRTVCYEGGIECIAPSVARLTALGDASPSTYGGNPTFPPNGRIQNALEDYKLSSLFAQLTYDYYGTITSSGAAGQIVPAWYHHAGEIPPPTFDGDQWSMYQGDIYSPVFQSRAGVTRFNSGG